MQLREDIRHGAWTLLSAIFLIASTFITVAEAREYTVQPGDFLGKIAQAHGCRVGQLLSVNPQIKNPDRVAAGMKLNVDCSNAPMAVLERRKPGSRKAKSIRMRLDTKTLEKKMRKRGFKPPSKFRGLIIEIGLKNGRVHTERAFDWKGLSKEPRGWNAASSIKFFAAIAALEQITKWGFKPSAWVEFHHLKTGKKTKCMIRQKNCTVKESRRCRTHPKR